MGFFKRIFRLETLGDLTETLGMETDPAMQASMRYLNRKITQQQRRKNRENMVSDSDFQRRR